MRRFVETALLTALMAVLCIAGCQKIETPNRSATPNSSCDSVTVSVYTASRVEKALAAADITLPEVVTYLNGHNLDVVDRSAWWRPHWAPATPPLTYYRWELGGAVADTTIEIQVRNRTSGPCFLQVGGVWIKPDGTVVRGPKSLVGWSDNGDGANSLPGVRP